MTILDEIVAHKREEIAGTKARVPFDELKGSILTSASRRSLSQALKAAPAPAIIAEVKRASPSKGTIRADLDPVRTAVEYAANGAAAVSVLTDSKYFSGSLEYIGQIRQRLKDTASADIPILRKDFIVDEYQLWETAAAGADATLLIVAALDDEALARLIEAGLQCSLDLLIEVHDTAELERALRAIAATADLGALSSSELKPQILLGINNRNLSTFEVDTGTTAELVAAWRRSAAAEGLEAKSPGWRRELRIVAESGIFSAPQLVQMAAAGANAFLIGESLVASGEPGENLARLIREHRQLKSNS